MKIKLIVTVFICILTFNLIGGTFVEEQNNILLIEEPSIPDIGY